MRTSRKRLLRQLRDTERRLENALSRESSAVRLSRYWNKQWHEADKKNEQLVRDRFMLLKFRVNGELVYGHVIGTDTGYYFTVQVPGHSSIEVDASEVRW